MEGDIFNGKYSVEDVQRIMNVNARPTNLMKPFRPYYRKSATENAPSWAEKREVNF